MSTSALPENWTRLPREVRDAVLKTLLDRRRQLGTATAMRLLKADRSKPLPASLEQTLFLRQQEQFGGTLAWTIAAPPILLEKVDAEKVRKAVTALARRHDLLHATFSKTGNAYQLRLEPEAPAPFSASKLPLTAAVTGAENWVRQRYEEMLAKPFDPEAGPLWRAELCSFAGRGVILLTFCSAIVDGESLYLIDRDLRALLADPVSQDHGEKDFDYADYAFTQSEFVRAGRFDGAMNWWRTRLSGGPPMAWADTREAIGASPLYEQILGSRTGRTLAAFAASHRTTPHVVLLTEFMRLLHDMDGSSDLWVTSATATRDLAGTDAMVGTFARQALLRFSWPHDGDPLAGVHAMLTETMDQAPVPHLLVRDMLEKTYPQAPSAYRYVFNHRLVGPAADEQDDVDIPFRAIPTRTTGRREEDILLLILQSGEHLRLHWYLREDRFDPADAENLLRRFDAALRRRLAP